MEERTRNEVPGIEIVRGPCLGPPAVFPHARFIRVSDAPGELIDNRRGQPELLASPSLALEAMLQVAGNRASGLDQAWAARLRERHIERIAKGAADGGRQTTGSDGKVHPRAIFDAIAAVADADYIGIADGGDLLSFARTGLQARTYMDAGAFGCLGVGVPFAIAAALAMPDRQVISVNGDGAFGINAMEIDTAVRPRRQGRLHRLQQRGLEHRWDDAERRRRGR